MPPRSTAFAIAAFWLGTTAWLSYRDLWPRLAPGVPPPFTIDLADEAQARAVQWDVFKRGRRTGRALTQASYDQVRDLYEIHGEFKLWNSPEMRGDPNYKIVTRYDVTRDGELRGIRAEMTVLVSPEPAKVEYTGNLEGPVAGGRFSPKATLTGPGVNVSAELAPVPVRARGSVMNPLQPVNRVWGLRRGQRWRVPVMDPLEDAVWLAFQGRPPQPRFLDAEVLPQTRELVWGPRRARETCLVTEYTGDNITARVWVRELDGLVLRQEATKDGEELVLERQH